MYKGLKEIIKTEDQLKSAVRTLLFYANEKHKLVSRAIVEKHPELSNLHKRIDDCLIRMLDEEIKVNSDDIEGLREEVVSIINKNKFPYFIINFYNMIRRGLSSAASVLRSPTHQDSGDLKISYLDFIFRIFDGLCYLEYIINTKGELK